MKELTVKVYDSVEAEYEIRNLKKLGYIRTQHAYWVEWWEKDNNRVIVERDF